jgi:hypothetical protein
MIYRRVRLVAVSIRSNRVNEDRLSDLRKMRIKNVAYANIGRPLRP